MRMEKIFFIDTFEADTVSDEVSIKAIPDGKVLVKHIDRIFICDLEELINTLTTIKLDGELTNVDLTCNNQLTMDISYGE